MWADYPKKNTIYGFPDRLNHPVFSISYKVPEKLHSLIGLGLFVFCCGRGLLRQRNKKQGTYCGVFQRCNVGEFGAWEMAAG